jgi:hypothetical protein
MATVAMAGTSPPLDELIAARDALMAMLPA